MTILTAIILGAVEGLTEFIPVSSSGHLIIVRALLNTSSGGLSFDAVLQLFASLALVVYFRKEVGRLFQTFLNYLFRKQVGSTDKILFWSVVLGTIPAVIFGLLLEKTMDTVFRSTSLVAATLLFGSTLMWWAQNEAQKNGTENSGQQLSVKKGIAVGFYQCLALLPGVSRSGASISGGMFSGLSRQDAARFSFVLSIPVLLGSGLKKLFEIRHELIFSGLGLPLLVGSIVSFITSLLAIGFLMHYLRDHKLDIFIWYRVVLALALFLFL
jgi:undecaprenyl-diphosphatase